MGCFFGLDVLAGLVQAPGPNTITLDPATDTNTVGTDHTVTATVEDEFGNLLAGESVHFDVTGGGTPDPAGGDDTTDADGEATFTFTNKTAGANTVTACVDADAGSDCDGGELSDTATKTWDRRSGDRHRAHTGDGHESCRLRSHGDGHGLGRVREPRGG